MPYHTAPLKDSALPHTQLCNFFAEQLLGLYRSEQELIPVIQRLRKQASMVELCHLLDDYMLQLEKQVIRLEEILGLLLLPTRAGDGHSIRGLIREINFSVGKTVPATITRDAAMIITIQKAIHYKIATYGSLEQLATSLGMEEACNLLHQSLEDEKDNDLLFSDLAERRINWLAEIERY
jgi:ferritin-like metal-binding protein YciE